MSVIEELLEEFREDAERPVEITLPNGRVLKFRAIRDYDELLELRQRAADFGKLVKAGKVPAELKPFAPKQAETIATVFLVSELSVEPKLEQGDVMKLCKEAPQMVAFVASELDRILSLG